MIKEHKLNFYQSKQYADLSRRIAIRRIGKAQKPSPNPNGSKIKIDFNIDNAPKFQNDFLY